MANYSIEIERNNVTPHNSSAMFGSSAKERVSTLVLSEKVLRNLYRRAVTDIR